MSRPATTPSWLPFAALGLPILGLTTAAVATTSPWPTRLPLHLGLWIAAGLAWAGALIVLPRLGRDRRDLRVLWAVALVLRLPAWLAPPVHSDDVYRFAWDGRVSRAGINPYRYPPAAPELDPLRDGVRYAQASLERAPPQATARDARPWARINNPDLPTIYPPAAQLVFLAAALLSETGLGPIGALKLVLGACDLGLLALLILLLRQRGEDPRWAIGWGWSPLVAIELGENAHFDALPLLGLVGMLWAMERGRPRLAGALLGLATVAKWITAPLFIVFRKPEAWLAGAAAMLLCALPFVGVGAAMTGSTGEFARRWRANDGLYALVHAGAERLVCAALDADADPAAPPAPPCSRPFQAKQHPELARLVTGRSHRTKIYPDELTAFLSHLAVAAVLGLVVIGVWWRRLPPLGGAEWLLGALLLATPTLHPWYVVWLVPLVVLTRRRAWMALAVLVPLAYVPLGRWLAGEPWRDPVWSRLLEHGVTWALLGWAALDGWRARRRRRAAAPAGPRAAMQHETSARLSGDME